MTHANLKFKVYITKRIYALVANLLAIPTVTLKHGRAIGMVVVRKKRNVV